MRKINNYVMVLFLAIFLTACETKSSIDESPDNRQKMIIDNANVILKNTKIMKQYRVYNEALLKLFDIDFRAITTVESDDIGIFANNEFKRLQSEGRSRSKSGKSILMVINTAEDKVRLEVSMALEPVYTDAFVSYIERKGFVPYFKNASIIDAIFAATELVMNRANAAKEGKEFIPSMPSLSIGAGANIKANIGQVDTSVNKENDVLSLSSDTPRDILDKYIDSLKKHNKNPNLDIYSDDSKVLYKNLVITDINQDKQVRILEPCTVSRKIQYSVDRQYAVSMGHPVKQRTCMPYFFKKEYGKWKLDMHTSAQLLRDNLSNQWYFYQNMRLKGNGIYYAFAFDGLRFDVNGFPQIVKQKYQKPKDARWGFKCGSSYMPGEDPKKHTRCWIKMLWNGSPAQIHLGMDVYDTIYAVGEGSSKQDNISYQEFIDYMASVPSGEKVTIHIKNSVKNKNQGMIIRQGIAP